MSKDKTAETTEPVAAKPKTVAERKQALGKKPSLAKQIAARIGEGVALIEAKLSKLNKPEEVFAALDKMSEADIRSLLDPSKKAS
jgi:hypothetical protein